MMMPARSLVPFGMSTWNDDDLRWFFEPTRDQPESPADVEREARIRWIFSGRDYSYERDEEHLRRFFHPNFEALRPLSPLTSFGFSSEEAIEHYERLTKYTRPPSGDGAAFLAWLEERANFTLYLKWLSSLDERVPRGAASPREAIALEEIRRAAETRLRRLVERYERNAAHAERLRLRAQREAQEEARRGRDSGRAASNTLQGTRRHRRFGELPPDPEIISRRRNA